MSLFELKVRHLVPPLGNGKSLKTNAIAEDGFDYAVKSQAEHPMLPFSEWFCYQLSQAIGMSCPSPAILVMPDGSRAFGSRIESGLADLQKEQQQSGSPPNLEACAGKLSAAYAMDLFIGNEDRHFGNFLFKRNSLNRLCFMPIDYSHAWWVRGWPLANITGKSCATTVHIQILQALGFWRTPDALFALGTLSQLSQETIARWLNEMPQDWLSGRDRDTLVTWWSSEEMHARVSKCVLYCKS